MPFYFYQWTDENESHLAEHGVSPEEFEEVVGSPDWVQISRTTGRPIAFGATSSGKYLACVYELMDKFVVLPITAYEPDEE